MSAPAPCRALSPGPPAAPPTSRFLGRFSSRPAPRAGAHRRVAGLALVLALAALAAAAAAQQPDLALLGGMHARGIGPAGMSGRVEAVDAVASDPRVIWVGAATGGVWKSTDGGVVFRPLFDHEDASSIGALAVSQSNPDVVWVGTGEAGVRNSMGVGRGVWRTVDGGARWSFLGLGKSERIARIRVDPGDADVAWVAALGPAWSNGSERGIYRTRDGGKTWDHVLPGDSTTGAADLAMDPANPRHLLAALWQYRRWPWGFRSGGPGSGLYESWDGGRTWRRESAADGLPEGELGRIALAFAPSAPGVAYALVEAKSSALVRSDDGGRTWTTVEQGPEVDPRPFYFSRIEVDPANENRLYRVGETLEVSEDGGHHFRTVVPSRKVHGDVHVVWIGPRGQRLIQGNDGGVGISVDRGASWRWVADLPLAQYYHVSVDDALPYDIYGGLQDNGSWVGPSSVWHTGGIRNYDFQRTGGGDGMGSVVDASDPRYLYGASQEGELYRFDRVTGGRTLVQPTGPDGVKLRFNWNAAIAADPFTPGTVYYGSQFLHETTDHGDTWRTISPDLTTNDPDKQKQDESGGLTLNASGAENHTTLITIAPSHAAKGEIWVGTDDGNVQLTRDGGAHWTNLRNRIRGPAAGTWVSHIEPSTTDAAAALVAFDDHRRGDWTPWIFRTADYGRTWERLGTDGLDGFVHTVIQDSARPSLLFAGTEFGLFVSFDAGRRWQKWTHGLPTVPVRSLVIQPREADLVIGTHGRAAYVLDDIRPLRALAADPGIARRPLTVFPAPTAYQHEQAEPLGYRSTGDGMFFGENRPYGALLSFWLGAPAATTADDGDAPAADSSRSAKLEVADSTGVVVRTLEASAERGLVRAVWDLRRDGFHAGGQRGAMDGPEVPPGTYTVRVHAGDATASTPVAVVFDPRVRSSVADRRANYDALVALGGALEQATKALGTIRDARGSVDVVLRRVHGREDAQARALGDAGRALGRSLDSLEIAFAGPQHVQGLAPQGDAVLAVLRGAYRMISAGFAAPTPNQRARARQAEAALAAAMARRDAVWKGPLARFRARVEEAGLGLVPAAP